MPEQMPLTFKLLRKVRGKPSRRSAIWGAQNAWANIQKRDWSGAVYFAQSATIFDPTWPEGYRMLGLAYRGQERFDEARAALQEALDAGIGDLRLLLDSATWREAPAILPRPRADIRAPWNSSLTISKRC